MAVQLELQNTSGTPVTSFSFADHTPGSPSTAQSFRFANTGGDAAPDPAAILLVLDGSGNSVREGERPVDERWLEIKALGTGSSTSTQLETGFKPWGRFRDFKMDPVPAAGYHDIQIRLNPPTTVTTAEAVTRTYRFAADPGATATTLSLGFTEHKRDGIILGYGDDSHLEILIGGDATEAGTPDNTFDVPDLGWLHLGIPFVKLLHTITTNNLDKDSAALVSGEEYWLVISLAGSTTLTETKSAKGTAPLSEDLAPSAPAGEIPLYRVRRHFDAIINTADLTTLTDIGGFNKVVSGLNATIGPGRMVLDNRLVDRDGTTVLTLTASSTNRIWSIPGPDGGYQVTTTAPKPVERARLLFESVTDGTTETSETDHRVVMGDIIPVKFVWTQDLSDALRDVAYAIFPSSRDGYIQIPKGITFAVGDNATGNAAGKMEVDIEISDLVGGFTDLFTSKGSDDRRPTVSFGTTEPTSLAALPEVLLIKARSRLRATIVFSTAYDVNQPFDAVMTLLVVIP